tara:strand:+ start:1042 stop:1308 length:267 start_codon:yes stop_codon:yes gene_type:complete
MFSKFDTNPQSEEFLPADLYEAQAEWEAEQAAEEEFQLSAPEGFESDDDSIGELSTFQSFDWDDDAEYYDEVDLYGAEWENYAVREWD